MVQVFQAVVRVLRHTIAGSSSNGDKVKSRLLLLDPLPSRLFSQLLGRRVKVAWVVLVRAVLHVVPSGRVPRFLGVSIPRSQKGIVPARSMVMHSRNGRSVDDSLDGAGFGGCFKQVQSAFDCWLDNVSVVLPKASDSIAR